MVGPLDGIDLVLGSISGALQATMGLRISLYSDVTTVRWSPSVFEDHGVRMSPSVEDGTEEGHLRVVFDHQGLRVG